MSFISAECLENVIGLSESMCECFDTPSHANLSLSGLFLDKLEGLDLNMANAAANCEHGTLWNILDDARAEGIKQFRTFLFLGLNKEYKKRHPAFKGAIGQEAGRDSLSLSGDYAGDSYYTNNIRGAYWKINRIGLVFTQAGTFDISIYDDREDGPLETVSVTSAANKINWNTLSTPIILPLTNDTGQAVRYDFLYDTSAITGLPKNNKLPAGCSCNKGFYYNEEVPNYSANGWRKYLMASGVSGSNVSSIEDRDNLSRGSVYSNGIVLDAEFTCDIQDLLCQSISDFDNGPLALAIATAIRYISGAFVIDAILASGNITFYTMTDRERLMGKKNSYTKSYTDLVNEIVKQFNISGNDCLICNNTGPTKKGILA